jgi:cell division protein FtsW (lipid II flippase)
MALRLVAPGYDRLLLAAVGMMSAVGITMLSLIAASGPDRVLYEGFATRQFLFVTAGFATLVAGAIASRYIGFFARYPTTILLAASLLTVATAIFGESINGARLWLALGPVQFQPSEPARLLLAAFIAIYLYDRRHLVASPWRFGPLDLPPAPYLLPLAAAVSVSVVVLVVQNDFGMAALVAVGAFAVLAAVLSSSMFVLIGIGVVATASTALFFSVPRVRDRVGGWLDPWTDPAAGGFQIVQADYAVAAGGLVGRAAPGSVAHVPEVHTDLILAAVSSHLGSLGAMAVISMASVIVCRCALTALRASDGLASLLALGLTVLVGLQTILIAGGTLRALPLTGLTLPWLSYGGTSMLVTMFAVGVILGLGARDNGPPSCSFRPAEKS